MPVGSGIQSGSGSSQKWTGTATLCMYPWFRLLRPISPIFTSNWVFPRCPSLCFHFKFNFFRTMERTISLGGGRHWGGDGRCCYQHLHPKTCPGHLSPPPDLPGCIIDQAWGHHKDGMLCNLLRRIKTHLCWEEIKILVTILVSHDACSKCRYFLLIHLIWP